MKVKRKTLAKECVFEGTGLHTGRKSFIHLIPQHQSKGIRFINPDSGNVVEVNLDNVDSLLRNTSVTNGTMSVKTIEHLMSALFAFEIDDIDIEIKGEEIPIYDGSSKVFADMLLKTGTVEKDDEIEVFTYLEDLVYVNGESFYKIEKSDKFVIECVYEHKHPLVQKQSYTFEFSVDNYIKEIAPAKTFGFMNEIEYLKKNNLALGGNLENAIVLDDEKIINPEMMSFKDEFVRHKINDLLGDLKLLGMRIDGLKIKAFRPSHRTNFEFVKLLKTRSGFYE